MSSELGLPSGWTRANLGDFISFQNGYAFKSNTYIETGAFVIRIGNVQDGFISLNNPAYIDESDSSVQAFKLRSGDILISLTGNVGRVAVINQAHLPAVLNQRVARLLVDSSLVHSFIFNLMRSDVVQSAVLKMAKGAAQLNISTKDISDISVQVPPLAEQKVIADKLDIWLAQVESIKARLECIPEILKQLRQSVLAAAVSGKLTEGWRRINTNHVKQDVYSIDKYWENEYKKNNKKYKKIEYPKSGFDLSAFPDSWVKTNVGRIFDVYVGATPSRQQEDFWNGEINWVSSSEVAFCRIQSTKENITDEGYKSTSTTIHPIGTVMLAMIGQGKTRGQAAILDIEACHNQNTAALRIPEKIAKSEFLYFYLLYKYEETRQVGSGNNQQAMNKAIVQGLEFPLPPFKEQIEIVDKIESFFEYIERVEGQVQVALDRVNNLTQSILAKAFRGELTAGWREANPELISGENSAEALLGRIKAERELAKPATKRGRGKA